MTVNDADRVLERWKEIENERCGGWKKAESVGVVVQGAEELVYIRGTPRCLLEYRSIVPRLLDRAPLPLFLPTSLTLSSSDHHPLLFLAESVILSPIHTPVRPSPSIFLCLACIHRYKPERNACLLQPVWLRATLVLPRSCSAKISVENSWK